MNIKERKDLTQAVIYAAIGIVLMVVIVLFLIALISSSNMAEYAQQIAGYQIAIIVLGVTAIGLWYWGFKGNQENAVLRVDLSHTKTRLNATDVQIPKLRVEIEELKRQLKEAKKAGLNSSQLEEQIRKLARALEDAETKVKQIPNLELQLSSVQAQLTAATELAKNANNLQLQLDKIQQELQQARVKSREVDRLEKQLQETKAELARITERAALVAGLEVGLIAAQSQLAAAKKVAEEVGPLNARIKSLEAELQAAKEAVKNMDTLKRELHEKRDALKKAHRAAEKAKGLETDLTAARTQAAQVLSLLAKLFSQSSLSFDPSQPLQEQILHIETEITQIRNQLGKKDERIQALERLLREAKDKTDQVDKLEDQLNAAQLLADKVPGLEKQIEELNKHLKQAQELADKVPGLEKQIEELNKHLKQAQELADKVPGLEKQIEELNKHLKQAQELADKVPGLEKQIEELNKHLKQAQELADKVPGLEKQIEEIERLKQAIAGHEIQKGQDEQKINQLESLVSENKNTLRLQKKKGRRISLGAVAAIIILVIAFPRFLNDSKRSSLAHWVIGVERPYEIKKEKEKLEQKTRELAGINKAHAGTIERLKTNIEALKNGSGVKALEKEVQTLTEVNARQKNAVDRLQRESTRVKTSMRLKDEEIADLQGQRRNLQQQQLDALTKVNNDWSNKLDTLRKQTNAQLETADTAARKTKKDYEERISELETRISTQKKTQEKRKQLQQEEIDSADKKLATLRQKIARLEAELDKLKAKNSATAKNLVLLKKTHDQFAQTSKKRLDALKKKHETVTDTIGQLTREKEQAEKKAARLKQERDSFSARVSGLKQNLQEMAEQKRELSDRVLAQSKTMRYLQEDKSKIQQHLKDTGAELFDTKQALILSKKNKASLRKQNKDLEKNLSAAKQEIKKLKGQQKETKAQKVQGLKKLVREYIVIKQNDDKELERQRQQLQSTKKRLAKVNTELNAKIEKVAQLEEEKKNLTNRNADLSGKYEQADKERTKLRQEKNAAEQLNKSYKSQLTDMQTKWTAAEKELNRLNAGYQKTYRRISAKNAEEVSGIKKKLAEVETRHGKDQLQWEQQKTQLAQEHEKQRKTQKVLLKEVHERLTKEINSLRGDVSHFRKVNGEFKDTVEADRQTLRKVRHEHQNLQARFEARGHELDTTRRILEDLKSKYVKISDQNVELERQIKVNAKQLKVYDDVLNKVLPLRSNNAQKTDIKELSAKLRKLSDDCKRFEDLSNRQLGEKEKLEKELASIKKTLADTQAKMQQTHAAFLHVQAKKKAFSQELATLRKTMRPQKALETRMAWMQRDLDKMAKSLAESKKETKRLRGEIARLKKGKSNG